MCKLLLRLYVFSLFFLAGKEIQAQQVFMQGWYWDYPKTAAGKSWADTLRLKAAALKQSGITHIWFPPHAVASFGTTSNGYDPKDLFIGNQTTGLGTRAALNAMLSQFTSQGIVPVADVIYNHRDGGAPEVNSAVKNYITNFYTASKEPFPSDRFRCALPVGGSTGNGAGDYYIKISSKTGNSRFSNYGYKLLAKTNRVGESALAPLNETEPNGGGDCSQANNVLPLGRNMLAVVETSAGCNTDEFKLTLAANSYFAAGDTVFIYLTNTGGYSDHRIYGIWSSSRNTDISSELLYQTYTNFNNLPSGRGQMNFESFKPNSTNAATTFLNGDWDGMFFFYDYDHTQKRTKDSLINYTKWNWSTLGVRGFRMDAIKHFSPEFVGDMLDSLHQSGMDPNFVVGEWYGTNATELSGWINNVKSYMNAGTLAAIQPKIFDFTLRENLRQACDNAGFDVRNVFTGSLRDAAGMSGFNAVTFVNNHDFRDASGFASLVRTSPNLAYAYILTNNQLGVPTIFYPDYYGYPAPSGGVYSYHPTNLPPYKTELDKLMKALKLYINGSPSVDYLNRFSTPYSANFIQGSSNRALVYQLQGFAANGNKDVIVAINFGNTTLKVDHGINTRGGAITPGTVFTDVLARSAFPFQVVSGSNQVYIELPPQSYSVWVQGSVPVVTRGMPLFTVTNEGKKAKLLWEAVENNEVSSFRIQRSSDGIQFDQIGTVTAAITDGRQAYAFTDVQPFVGQKTYYRVEIVRKDNQQQRTEIRDITIDAYTYSLQLLGNPVNTNLDFTFDAPAGMATARIIDQQGHIMLRQRLSGDTRTRIPVSKLSSGTYVLVISMDGKQYTASFVKQ
ncbi:MAG: alpha-amylase family glycosyl hydrolase [Bacteroidetes bacterium]|nr:alpha-amylase family glycosyl hydrolase [Bacteroidota bacterium]